MRFFPLSLFIGDGMMIGRPQSVYFPINIATQPLRLGEISNFIDAAEKGIECAWRGVRGDCCPDGDGVRARIALRSGERGSFNRLTQLRDLVPVQAR